MVKILLLHHKNCLNLFYSYVPASYRQARSRVNLSSRKLLIVVTDGKPQDKSSIKQVSHNFKTSSTLSHKKSRNAIRSLSSGVVVVT